MQKGISLFIPIYNVGNSIENDLKVAYHTLNSSGINFEIIVVEDNHTVNPCQLNNIFDSIKQSQDKQIRYIAYSNGPSRRENLAKSFSAAKYELIGFLDADMSCKPSFFLKAAELLEKEKVDIVIGSRYVKGAKVKRLMVRRFYSFVYRTFIKILFDTKIHDHQCGLKIFHKKCVMPVIEKMGYDDTFTRGWFWDTELLIRAQKQKLKIIEMPVEWYYSDFNSHNIFRELKALKRIFEVKNEVNL